MQKIQEKMQQIEQKHHLYTPSEHMLPRCNPNSKSETTAQIMKCECIEKQGTLQITPENKYYCVAPVVNTPSN